MTVTTIELSQSLVRLAEQYITARRRSGESLLEAAGYLAQAHEEARDQYGAWTAFLLSTGTSRHTAEQFRNIHERAQLDNVFADAVRTNWLSLTTAALLARPNTPQEVIDQALTSDEPPTKSEVQSAISQYRTVDPDQQFSDEPLTDYERTVEELYTKHQPASAIEYVPAPMSQPMSVLTSQGTVEWYTPPAIIERARKVLGGIDLDPASNETAQQWIRASTYYTQADNGLALPWAGSVWLNPPFDDTPAWVDCLDSQYIGGDVSAALLLVNSAPGYNWWEDLWRRRPICMLRERLYFVQSNGEPAGQAKKGQTIAYYGNDVERFAAVFGDLGRIILP
jgi:hypothetical protein